MEDPWNLEEVAVDESMEYERVGGLRFSLSSDYTVIYLLVKGCKVFLVVIG